MIEDLVTYLFLGLAILVPPILLWMAIKWAIDDAKERQGSPVLAVILVLLFFPLGLLLWLMIRPNIPSALEMRVQRRKDYVPR